MLVSLSITMRFLLLLLLISNTTFSQVKLNEGLVAYYPFNGNANDESGNKNNPSKVKATLTSDRFGKPNSAYSFNGKNNFIRIPDDPSLHLQKSLSISAWVLINGFYEGKCHGNRIIMKGSSDINNGNYVLTFDDNHYTNGGNCFTDKPDTRHQSFYGPFNIPIKNSFIVPGKWYLLTYTYDGLNANLYVDCALYAKGIIKNYSFSNNEDLFFGKMDNYQYPYWFNGLLDEVRIYNRALKKEEILTLCDKRPGDMVPEISCSGVNFVSAKFNYMVTNCTTVSFNLLETKTNKIKKIEWLFGDGSSSGKLSPVHGYKKYGAYTVKTIITSIANCKDTFSKKILIQELKTDFVYSEQDNPGEILFKSKNNKATLSWDFDDGESKQNESVVNHIFKQTKPYTIQMFAVNSTGCTDTVEKKINITLPEIKTALIPENNTLVIINIPDTLKLEQRINDVVKAIPVEQDSLIVSLYDNGIIDGDSITLVYNNNIILTHQLLSDKPLILHLKIDRQRDNNELLMYAENLGSIPPNTALMIIKDGDKRYEVNISSTKTSNGVISFSIKK